MTKDQKAALAQFKTAQKAMFAAIRAMEAEREKAARASGKIGAQVAFYCLACKIFDAWFAGYAEAVIDWYEGQ